MSGFTFGSAPIGAAAQAPAFGQTPAFGATAPAVSFNLGASTTPATAVRHQGTLFAAAASTPAAAGGFTFGPAPFPKPNGFQTPFKPNPEVYWNKDKNSMMNLFEIYMPNSNIVSQLGEKNYYTVDLVAKSV